MVRVVKYLCYYNDFVCFPQVVDSDDKLRPEG
jgi:hypothetical protein